MQNRAHGGQKSQKRKFWVLAFSGPNGGDLTPKSCPNFLFWTLLCPSDPSVASQHVPPVTGYVHAPDPMHTHGYPMGSDGVKMVKKSIFQLWSGIVLGWSEWPKNAPKVPKKYFFGSTMPCGGTLGCHLDTRPSTEIVIWP